jgi:hypothetical protein
MFNQPVYTSLCEYTMTINQQYGLMKSTILERERDLWKWKHNRTMEIFKKMQTCSLENSISSSSQMSEAAGYLIVKWFSIEGRSL